MSFKTEPQTMECIALNKIGNVGEIILNRPKKLNAMSRAFFVELDQSLKAMDNDEEVRCIVIRAKGKCFTAGLDLASAMSGFSSSEGTTAQQSSDFRKVVKLYQKPFLRMNKILKPILCLVHGYCIGGGIDLASACDMRVCSNDALFSIREIKVGLTADIGTLQRIERIMNSSAAREMAYTGDYYSAEQMKQWGFVSHVFEKDQLLEKGMEIARKIAENSPLVLSGVKNTLEYARDHSLKDGFDQVALWNAAFMKSDDLTEAMTAFFEKRKPKFKSKL